MATFDPKKVTVAFTGLTSIVAGGTMAALSQGTTNLLGGTMDQLILSGYVDDTFIEVEPARDAFDRTIGAAGDIGWINRNCAAYDVSLTLMQTSQDHAFLSTLLALDKEFNSGIGILTIYDNRAGGINFPILAGNARITKEPDLTMGGTLQGWTWEFKTENAIYAPQGND
jgi:hypothetical protein